MVANGKASTTRFVGPFVHYLRPSKIGFACPEAISADETAADGTRAAAYSFFVPAERGVEPRWGIHGE